MNPSQRRLLCVTEVAKATGLSPNAVYRAIWDGELPASKLRGRLRVQIADLDAWIDSNLVAARARTARAPGPGPPTEAKRAGPGPARTA